MAAGPGAIGMALLYKKSGAVDRSLSRGRGTHKQAPAFLSTRALRILAEQMICTARRLILEAGTWQPGKCHNAFKQVHR